MIPVPVFPDEKGIRCESVAAHSTVRDDEPCIPLCSDEFRMREGQEVGFSPKSGYLPVNIVKSFGEDKRIHK